MDLLSAYDPNDLTVLKQRAKEAEDLLVSVIEAYGVRIDRYASLEEFLEKN